ncbi:MAG: TonB-dependent receptor, partial [Bacteroidaceae bacterium]
MPISFERMLMADWLFFLINSFILHFMNKSLTVRRASFICLLLLYFSVTATLTAQTKAKRIDFRGFVLEQATKMPIPGATINLPQYGVWAISDLDGLFTLKQVPVGTTSISIRVIGMISIEQKVEIGGRNSTPKFYMNEENFALDEVIVTAKNNKVGASTASSISRSAIDHLQATSLTDIMELLPGQLASNPTLNSPGKASLRQVQTDALNSMGTSIVFNGAPVSNNANLQIGNTAKEGSLNTSFTSTAGSGTDMRQISVDNIESVDVIRGIPSVEYGDLTSGVIIINPKAGVYPVQLRLKINPTLTQASVGKGFGLGKKAGNISFDFDYAKSLSDERRPYQAFQRFTGNVLYSKVFGAKLNTTTGIGFYSDLDAQKLDPSDVRYQRVRSSKNTGLKFNTNIVWNSNYKFLKFIRMNLSANYEKQKGYNQEIRGNYGYMVTSAMQDGTITSNHP